MTAMWYYLDGFTENGPYSGQELKQLTDSGAVIPSTPIKKIQVAMSARGLWHTDGMQLQKARIQMPKLSRRW